MNGGRPPKLSAAEREMIYLRYQLWAYNRPATIAHDYNVSPTYVTIIGTRKTRKDQQCQLRRLKKPSPR